MPISPVNREIEFDHMVCRNNLQFSVEENNDIFPNPVEFDNVWDLLSNSPFSYLVYLT